MGLWDERFDAGSIGTGCSALLPGYQPPTRPVPDRNETYAPSPRRPATSRRGLEGNRPRGKAGARRTQEGLALAQARKVDVILVIELTRWGRSMLDLFHTRRIYKPGGVSLVAQTGLQFDLRSAQGKLIASLMAALAEFERDLLRERVRSGIAAARKRVSCSAATRSARQGRSLRAASTENWSVKASPTGKEATGSDEQEYDPRYRQARPRCLMPRGPYVL